MDRPPVTYYALDLEKRELERTLTELAHSDLGAELQGKVNTKGLCATYEDGLALIQSGGLQAPEAAPQIRDRYMLERINAPRDPSPGSSASEDTELTPPSTPGHEQAPFHMLFLGSSLGNFGRGGDAEFLRSLPLEPGSGNTILIGLDHCTDGEAIEVAYNDPKGLTKDFIMNGLRVAGRTLGDEHLFDEGNWEYVGKYNEELRASIHFVLIVCIHSPACREARGILQVEVEADSHRPDHRCGVHFPARRTRPRRGLAQSEFPRNACV